MKERIKKMELTLEDFEGYSNDTPLNTVEEIKVFISKIVRKKVNRDPAFSYIDGEHISTFGLTLQDVENHLIKNTTREILETLQVSHQLFQN